MRIAWAAGSAPQFAEFSFGDVVLRSRLEDGSFPHHTQLVPKEHTTEVQMDTEVLQRAVRQLAGVSKESHIILLLWSAARLTAQARQDRDEASVDLQATADMDGRIAFDGRFILRYLDGKNGPVTMCVTGPQGPVLFKRYGAGELVQMPMTVQWEGEPAQAAKPTGTE